MKEEPKTDTPFPDRVGISSDSLKAKFDRSKPPEGDLKKFHDTLSARIKDGRARAIADYKFWRAVDLTFQTAFSQVNPIILQKILDTSIDPTQALSQLESWGISERTLFTKTMVDGKEQLRLNESTFYKVLIPITLTYTHMRWAKLYNDRDQFPLLKFEPFNSTVANSLIAEAKTAIFEKQGHQMGDRAVLKQVILQALKYATAFSFPMEAWYCEKSKDSKGDEYCVKEGIRYHIPHPTRTFYDMSHRPSTFNTDSGCEFAGHWRILRWGDVDGNKHFWNKDKVSYGRSDWFGANDHYFKEVYPCTMAMPVLTDQTNSREGSAAFYSTADRDKAVFVCDFFWKLVPKDWGLGDWEYPCWMRFVVASDDTVIYAEPIPYTPVLYMGLDVDENQARNSSFALQLMPFQVHIGNIVSQIILTARGNATKVVLYDEDQIEEKDIRQLKSESNDVSRMKFLPHSGRKSRNAQQDPTKILQPLQLPQGDTAAQSNQINTLINVMERTLGISPQEIGQAGVHVQTAEESRILSSNTSQRVDFTGTHVDDFMDAWKKQKHMAAMAFMDEEFIAEVSGNKSYIPVLKEMGFEMMEEGKSSYVIKGKKSKLAMEAFVSIREGKNRSNNPQIAQVLLQSVQVVASNQMLAEKVGPEQIVQWINRATRLAGGPEDQQFDVAPENMAQVIEQLQQQLAQAQQELQAAGQQIQQLGSEVQGGQQELQKASISAQADIAMQQMKNESALNTARINAQASLESAQIAAKQKMESDLAAQQVKLQETAMKLQSERVVEAAKLKAQSRQPASK